MSDTTHDPNQLNQQAAHDTGLYDPTIHDNQIVAMYDTETQARAAQDVLLRSGIPAANMQVMDRAAVTGVSGKTATDSGLWGAITALFVPEEDRTIYNTAVARGHAMLVVTPDATMNRHRLIQSLEATGPLDFDARLEEWRQAGYDTTGAAPGTPTSNVATAGHAVDAGLNTRVGRREQMQGPVRSYIADRPAPGMGTIEQRSVQASGTDAEPRVATPAPADRMAP